MKITTEEQLATILLNRDIPRYGDTAELFRNLKAVTQMGQDAAGLTRKEMLMFQLWSSKYSKLPMGWSPKSASVNRTTQVEYTYPEKRFLRKPITHTGWNEEASEDILTVNWDKIPKVQIKNKELARRFLLELEEVLTKREEAVEALRAKLQREEAERRHVLASLGLEAYREVLPGETQDGGVK